MRKGFVVLLVIFFIFVAWLQPLDFGTKEIIIPKNATGNEIAEILSDHNILRSKNEFLIWLRLMGMEKNLKFGTYYLSRYKNPVYLINELSQSYEKEIIVTIPEGLTIYETARLLESRQIIDREVFLDLCFNLTLIKNRFGLSAGSLEGYLFPDTYFFSESQSDTTIIEIMVNNFKHHAARLGINDRATIDTVVIVASLVEKEARYDDERPLVAGVFLNRVKLGRPIESCATVIYAMKLLNNPYPGYKSIEKLTENNLKIKSPYNTYLHTGLPPGPICSPGEKSLKAALFPARTEFLYFVLKGDGRHHFSKTYKEHCAAQARYLNHK